MHQLGHTPTQPAWLKYSFSSGNLSKIDWKCRFRRTRHSVCSRAIAFESRLVVPKKAKSPQCLPRDRISTSWTSEPLQHDYASWRNKVHAETVITFLEKVVLLFKGFLLKHGCNGVNELWACATKKCILQFFGLFIVEARCPKRAQVSLAHGGLGVLVLGTRSTSLSPSRMNFLSVSLFQMVHKAPPRLAF